MIENIRCNFIFINGNDKYFVMCFKLKYFSVKNNFNVFLINNWLKGYG